MCVLSRMRQRMSPNMKAARQEISGKIGVLFVQLFHNPLVAADPLGASRDLTIM